MNKKKVLSLAALAAVAVSALVIHDFLGREPAATAGETDGAAATATPGNEGFFETYRRQRKENLDGESAQLEAILEDESADEITKRAAQEQIMALVEQHQAEEAAEILLTAKGFSPAAVVIHRGYAHVLVGCEGGNLTAEETAKILEICRETGDLDAQNIKIIPVMSENN